MNNLEIKDQNLALTLKSTKSNKIENNVENKEIKGNAKKIFGVNKHFSPANKEWKNSTYAYNKNSIRSISILDKMAGKMIKGYFNLSNSKKIARSKRMRTLIRRSTVKKLFVSKPEIKQTSDKVMITVYTFDREKQFYIRKLYFYNKSLNLYKLWLNKTLSLVNTNGSGFKNGRNIHLNKMIKRTANPLYVNSLTTNNNSKLTSTSRNIRNKTYIHKLLIKKVSLLNHPFLSILRKRKAKRSSIIQKRANVIFLNRIRKNYFSKIFAKKLGLSLRKNRLSYKRLINKPSRKTRLFKRNANKANFRKTRLFKRNANKANFRKTRISKGKDNVRSKIRIPYFNLKLKNEMKFFFFKLAYVKKFDYLRKLFFFSFMKYALSLFQTKVNVYNTSSVMRNNELILEFTVSNPEKNNLAIKYYKLIKNYSNNKLKLIQRINMELLQFLDLTLKNNNHSEKVNNKEKIYSLYEYFKANYFLLFIRKSLKKELLALNYYTKFIINQYKFGKFLPGLKLLISKIYSKKVELNLVNLKYPHLNSDIYTESIATKLKKKTGLLKVLRRSLNLARTPYEFYSVDNAANLNNLKDLIWFNSLNVNSGAMLNIKDNKLGVVEGKDKMDVILNKLYPNSLTQSFNLNSFITLASENSITNSRFAQNAENANKTEKVDNLTAHSTDMLNLKKAAKNVKVLNQIRYKWVTGVRLEAAGRLTRRYTASRSVFKFRYKGNLKNIDYSLKPEDRKDNMSTIMLRNQVKPNLQYSFAKSKRRIGAFGIKGWINSY